MLKNCVRSALAASMWVTAIGLMVVASAEQSWILAFWSVLVGLGGCVLTGWQLLVVERVRTEDIAHVSALAAVEHVRRLESVK